MTNIIKGGGEYTAFVKLNDISKNIIAISKDVTLNDMPSRAAAATTYINEAQNISDTTTMNLNSYTIAEPGDSVDLDDTFSVIWNPNMSGKYTLQRMDRLEFTDAMKLTTWVEDIKKVFTSKMEEIKANGSVYTQTNTNANNAATAFDQLLNDRNFQEIQKLEKYVMYHMYYFPGGSPKLRINGHGTDTDKQEFDNLDASVDPFSNSWDPRYMVDYIDAAHQGGFHKWFITVINTDAQTTFKPMSFSQFMSQFVTSNAVDWVSGEVDPIFSTELAGAMAGIEFMSKLDALINFLQDEAGSKVINKTRWAKVSSKLANAIAKNKLALSNNLIKQTETEFKRENIGWMAPNWDYAFDCAQYTAELTRRYDEYNEFKEKLWALLKESPSLQLCTNNVNVTGNNITIQQEMSCVQTIQDSTATTNISGPTTHIDGGNDVTPSNIREPTTTPMLEPAPNVTATTEHVAESDAEHKPVAEPETSNVKLYVIVALVIVIIIIIGLAWFKLMYKPGSKMQHVPQQSQTLKQKGGYYEFRFV